MKGESIQCHFGHDIVKAEYISDKEIRCKTPKVVLKEEASVTVNVWVTSPGVFCTNSRHFTFFAPLFVSDRANHVVHMLDAHRGTVRGTIVKAGAGGLVEPQGLAMGKDDNLYVASAGTNQILRYDGQGNFLEIFANLPPKCGVRGIAQGPDGNWYAACYNINLVLAFNGKSGQQLGIAARAGGLKRPTGLAFGPNNLLYVVSSGSHQILQYARGGYFRGMVSREYKSGQDVNFHRGKVYATGGVSGEVSTFLEAATVTAFKDRGAPFQGMAFVQNQAFVASGDKIVRFSMNRGAAGHTQLKFGNKKCRLAYVAARQEPIAAPPPAQRSQGRHNEL